MTETPSLKEQIEKSFKDWDSGKIGTAKMAQTIRAALENAADGVDREALWRAFLTSYLDNVIRELPDRFRAKQLKNGGAEAALVHEFATRFLKQPFMKAVDDIILALVGKAGCVDSSKIQSGDSRSVSKSTSGYTSPKSEGGEQEMKP